jgi:hypothetical protein
MDKITVFGAKVAAVSLPIKRQKKEFFSPPENIG